MGSAAAERGPSMRLKSMNCQTPLASPEPVPVSSRGASL